MKKHPLYRRMEKVGLGMDKNIVQKWHVLTAGNTAFPLKESWWC
jgi:hypothetical protein